VIIIDDLLKVSCSIILYQYMLSLKHHHASVIDCIEFVVL